MRIGFALIPNDASDGVGLKRRDQALIIYRGLVIGGPGIVGRSRLARGGFARSGRCGGSLLPGFQQGGFFSLVFGQRGGVFGDFFLMRGKNLRKVGGEAGDLN